MIKTIIPAITIRVAAIGRLIVSTNAIAATVATQGGSTFHMNMFSAVNMAFDVAERALRLAAKRFGLPLRLADQELARTARSGQARAREGVERQEGETSSEDETDCYPDSDEHGRSYLPAGGRRETNWPRRGAVLIRHRCTDML